MDVRGVSGQNYGEGSILKNMGAAPRLNSTGKESLQRYNIIEDGSGVKGLLPQYAVECQDQLKLNIGTATLAKVGKEGWVPMMINGQTKYLSVEGLHERLGLKNDDIREAGRGGAQQVATLIEAQKAVIKEQLGNTTKALDVFEKAPSLTNMQALYAAAKNGPDKEILLHIKSYLGRFEGSSLNSPQQVAEAKKQVVELRKQSWF